jgi:hypothetical protein
MAPAFHILDHPLLPTPYNHRFFVEKFAEGFTHQGFDVRVVKRIGEIDRPGFVMVSNHDCFHRLANGRLQRAFASGPLQPGSTLSAPIGRRGRLRTLKRLARHVNGRDDLAVVAWSWHPDSSLVDSLETPLIYAGESYWEEPQGQGQREWRSFNQRREDALPIEFAAAVDPYTVGEGCANQEIDCCFVGAASYKPDWQKAFSAQSGNRIIGTPPYVSEADRLEILRNSKVALGLHSDSNIANCLPVERVYEGLALGAVVVSDNPFAVNATDGIAHHASTLEEARELVEHYASNDRERTERRERGLEFARDRGTYAHRAAAFIDLREKLLATTA